MKIEPNASLHVYLVLQTQEALNICTFFFFFFFLQFPPFLHLLLHFFKKSLFNPWQKFPIMPKTKQGKNKRTTIHLVKTRTLEKGTRKLQVWDLSLAVSIARVWGLCLMSIHKHSKARPTLRQPPQNLFYRLQKIKNKNKIKTKT